MCDVISIKKRCVCKIVTLVVRKKKFRVKRFISLEEINLSRQKQNYRFYLFDKSWNFSVKHVIYTFNIKPTLIGLRFTDWQF